MPTEAQFEEAKTRFFAAADDADDLLGQTRRANGLGALRGGKLTGDVDRFVDVTGRQLGSVAGDLRELARECRRRAEECRQAAAALADFNRANEAYRRDVLEHEVASAAFADDPTAPEPGDPPTRPQRPPPPPPYVDL